MLAGNKQDRDCDRQVSEGEGIALAREWGCPYLPTSARTRVNCVELFKTLIRSVPATIDRQYKGKRAGPGRLLSHWLPSPA